MDKIKFPKFVFGIFRIPVVSTLLRGIFYNYGYCKICKVPWSVCNNKTVDMSYGTGSFETCDHCWENSTLEDLKDIYEQGYFRRKSDYIRYGETIGYSLTHCLSQVENEYIKTHGSDKIKLDKRKKVINKILKHG